MSYLHTHSYNHSDFYTHPNSYTHSNRLQINRQRSSGIAFAILIHVGLVVAIGSGLTIHSTPQEPPPLIVRAIDPPTVIPPPAKPIDDNTFIKKISTATPERPTVNTEPTDQKVVDEKAIKSPPTDLSGGTSQIIEAKIDPRYPLTQPSYPAVSRRLGEQGTVELSLYILADGRIGEVRIERGSGFARLDEAAQQHALKSWRLLPQQIDGSASAGWQRIAITFRLRK